MHLFLYTFQETSGPGYSTVKLKGQSQKEEDTEVVKPHVIY